MLNHEVHLGMEDCLVRITGGGDWVTENFMQLWTS